MKRLELTEWELGGSSECCQTATASHQPVWKLFSADYLPEEPHNEFTSSSNKRELTEWELVLVY